MFTILPGDEAIGDIAQVMAERFSEREASSVVLFLTIARGTVEARNAVEGWLRSHGLSQGRFAVLMCLNLEPDKGMTPSEVAERVSSTRATVTGLVTGLERDGLLQREPVPGDRRKVLLKLTDEGKELLRTLVPRHLRRLIHLLSDVTPEEQAVVLSVVNRVRAAVPTLPE